MKIELTAIVTQDNGDKFMDAHIIYYGVPRHLFPLMEKDILTVFEKWNAWDLDVQAQKQAGKPPSA